MTDTKPQIDSTFLFGELTKRFAKHPPEVQQRITAHVRAKSGHSTLPSYHSNGASEDQKIELYKECLNAILQNDYSGLSGSIPTGQASSEQVETAVKEKIVEKLGVAKLPSNIIVSSVGFDKPKVNPLPNRDSVLPKVPAPVFVPAIVATAEPPAAVRQSIPVTGDKVAEAVARLTEALTARQADVPHGTLNPEFVADLVRKEVKQCLDGFYRDMQLEVQKAVNTLKWDMVKAVQDEVKSWTENIAERLTKEDK